MKKYSILFCFAIGLITLSAYVYKEKRHSAKERYYSLRNHDEEVVAEMARIEFYLTGYVSKYDKLPDSLEESYYQLAKERYQIVYEVLEHGQEYTLCNMFNYPSENTDMVSRLSNASLDYPAGYHCLTFPKLKSVIIGQ